MCPWWWTAHNVLTLAAELSEDAKWQSLIKESAAQAPTNKLK